jgi:hypothetical protein
VIGWVVANEPVIATACVVAADFIGAAMMVPKVYRDPASETLATFALASLQRTSCPARILREAQPWPSLAIRAGPRSTRSSGPGT